MMESTPFFTFLTITKQLAITYCAAVLTSVPALLRRLEVADFLWPDDRRLDGLVDALLLARNHLAVVRGTDLLGNLLAPSVWPLNDRKWELNQNHEVTKTSVSTAEVQTNH